MNNLGIKEIGKDSDKTLRILWSDNQENFYDTTALRKQCPCAYCVDETTGKKKLDPTTISDALRAIAVKSVGKYALNILFSDGHSSGIYSFKLLHNMITS